MWVELQVDGQVHVTVKTEKYLRSYEAHFWRGMLLIRGRHRIQMNNMLANVFLSENFILGWCSGHTDPMTEEA